MSNRLEDYVLNAGKSSTTISRVSGKTKTPNEILAIRYEIYLTIQRLNNQSASVIGSFLPSNDSIECYKQAHCILWMNPFRVSIRVSTYNLIFQLSRSLEN